MIGSGMEALRETEFSTLSVPAVYRRRDGGEEGIVAVPGRSVFRSAGLSGAWTRFETRDFIVPAGSPACTPEQGDAVLVDGREYEVLSPNGEPCWRWSDPRRTARRIHTKGTGGGE